MAASYNGGSNSGGSSSEVPPAAAVKRRQLYWLTGAGTCAPLVSAKCRYWSFLTETPVICTTRGAIRLDRSTIQTGMIIAVARS